MSEESPEYGSHSGSRLAPCAGSVSAGAAASGDAPGLLGLARDRDSSPLTPYYQDAYCTIYHADCREVMPSLSHSFVVITDPPYGISHSSGHVSSATTAPWMEQEIRGDSDTQLRDEVLAGRTEWACFGSIKMPSPCGTRATVVWDKGPASGMGDLSFPFKLSWELIYFKGGGWTGSRDEGVIKNRWIVTRASMGRQHPNEKPVALMAYLISKHVDPVIIDPFMGSGTTLVAAKALNRRAIGIEIEERYCEIAARRLQQEVLNFTPREAGQAGEQGLLVPAELDNHDSAHPEASQRQNHVI